MLVDLMSVVVDLDVSNSGAVVDMMLVLVDMMLALVDLKSVVVDLMLEVVLAIVLEVAQDLVMTHFLAPMMIHQHLPLIAITVIVM